MWSVDHGAQENGTTRTAEQVAFHLRQSWAITINKVFVLAQNLESIPWLGNGACNWKRRGPAIPRKEKQRWQCNTPYINLGKGSNVPFMGNCSQQPQPKVAHGPNYHHVLI